MNAAKTMLAIVSLALLISCSGIANGPNGGTNPPPVVLRMNRTEALTLLHRPRTRSQAL